MSAVVSFKNLTLGYDRHPAVHHLDGTVARGQLVAVVGPNGAGKSTLLKGIMGQVRALEGRVELAGVRRGQIAYLPQQVDIDRSFPIEVFDLVALGMWRDVGLFRGFGAKRDRAVLDAIAAVGLHGFERRPIGSLSGGQFQRALFARLLLQDAPVILLDEPFTSIDAKTAADLMALVRRWHGEQRTIVAVLHDLEQVRRNFPHTLLLAREPVSWGPTAEVLTPENLLSARRLCEAHDDQAAICDRSSAA